MRRLAAVVFIGAASVAVLAGQGPQGRGQGQGGPPPAPQRSITQVTGDLENAGKKYTESVRGLDRAADAMESLTRAPAVEQATLGLTPPDERVWSASELTSELRERPLVDPRER